MPETDQKLNTVLFLCQDNQSTSRIAEILFESEGKKMEVAWMAKSAGFNAIDDSEPAMSASAVEFLSSIGLNDDIRSSRRPLHLSENDLKSAELVVVLRENGEPDLLRQKFPAWKGNVEVWDLPLRPDSFSAIQSNLQNLLVRLILKGGKRTPIINEQKQSQTATVDVSKANVRVQLESKGRGGKRVTVITGLLLNDAAMSELATMLKQACGTGGTVKDDCIEIQGDQCKRILEELSKRGYKAKRSGGK